MENIRTVLADLPATIKGYTICKDDYYTVILNRNLTWEQNLISYQHELLHIFDGDFEKKASVGMIELYAHQKIEKE